MLLPLHSIDQHTTNPAPGQQEEVKALSLMGRVACVYGKMGLLGAVLGDIHGLRCELR